VVRFSSLDYQAISIYMKEKHLKKVSTLVRDKAMAGILADLNLKPNLKKALEYSYGETIGESKKGKEDH
jgi:hypothetical protein